MDPLANGEDSDEMQHNAAFHQGLRNIQGQNFITFRKFYL